MDMIIMGIIQWGALIAILVGIGWLMINFFTASVLILLVLILLAIICR